MTDTKFTFLHLEWEGCPTVEVTGAGELTVNGEAVPPEVFTKALHDMALKWKAQTDEDLAARPPQAMGIDLTGRELGKMTGMFIKGPFPAAEAIAGDGSTG